MAPLNLLTCRVSTSISWPTINARLIARAGGLIARAVNARVIARAINARLIARAYCSRYCSRGEELPPWSSRVWRLVGICHLPARPAASGLGSFVAGSPQGTPTPQPSTDNPYSAKSRWRARQRALCVWALGYRPTAPRGLAARLRRPAAPRRAAAGGRPAGAGRRPARPAGARPAAPGGAAGRLVTPCGMQGGPWSPAWTSYEP